MKTKFCTHLSRITHSFWVVGGLLLSVANLSAQAVPPQTFALTTSSDDGGFDGQVQQSGSNSTNGTIRVGTSASKVTGFLMFDISSLLAYSAEEIVSVKLSFQMTGAQVNNAVDIQHSLVARTEQNFDGVWTSNGAAGSDWESVGRISGTGWANNVGTIDVTSMFLKDLANTSGASVVYSSFRMFAPTAVQGANNAFVDLASSENTTAGILIPTLTITVQAIPEPAHLAVLLGISTLAFMFFRRHRCRA